MEKPTDRICVNCGEQVVGIPAEAADYCKACRAKMDDSPGTLRDGEPHPSAASAFQYVKDYMIADPKRWIMTMEAFASTAISGNRNAEVCLSTIQRLNNGWPVSDRYVFGLAWSLMQMERLEAGAKA